MEEGRGDSQTREAGRQAGRQALLNTLLLVQKTKTPLSLVRLQLAPSLLPLIIIIISLIC